MNQLSTLQRQENGGVTHAMSPVGVDTLLALLTLGASGNGRAQLEHYFASKPTRGSRRQPVKETASGFLDRLAVLNNVQGVSLQSFLFFQPLEEAAATQEAYAKRIAPWATAETIDLCANPPEAAARINDLIERTCDFSDVLKPDDLAEAVAVVLNLLKFTGAWYHPFPLSATEQKPFYPLDGTPCLVPMMQQTDELATYVTDSVQMVRLRFTNYAYADFCMGLDDNASFPANLEARTCTLSLPKFKYQADIELVDLLCKAGCDSLFTAGNLCEMSSPRMFISIFKQTLSVSVDELGAEAKAVTVAVGSVECVRIPPPPVTIVFDRPFRFRIVVEDFEIVHGVYARP